MITVSMFFLEGWTGRKGGRGTYHTTHLAIVLLQLQQTQIKTNFQHNLPVHQLTHYPLSITLQQLSYLMLVKLLTACENRN